MNIRVDLNYPIKDGTEVVFRSPVDCSQVTGLKVYYPDASKEFVFADAHGNNVGDIDHLFAENVVVKVILDVTTGMAFVQNADTNAYLEAKFASKAPAGFGLGENGGKVFDDFNIPHLKTGFYQSVSAGAINGPETADNLANFKYGTMQAEGRNGWLIHEKATYKEYAARRYTADGCTTWSPWEYENPPMIKGKEYRTTEKVEGKTVYKRITTDGVYQYRLEDETTWENGIPGAAPDGYGLGETASRSGGNWSTSRNCFQRGTNGSPDGEWWHGIICKEYGSIGTQLAFKPNNGVWLSAMRGCKSNGTFCEWEYVNPPMLHNVEYRTTERFLGKPVYTKLIDLGELVDFGTEDAEYTIEVATGVDKFVDMQHIQYANSVIGATPQLWPFPVELNRNQSNNIEFHMLGVRPGVLTGATLLLKYTKE